MRTRLIFILLALLTLLVVPGIAGAQYVLKHPSREHCRAHYVRRLETIKHRRETVCVHTPPPREEPAEEDHVGSTSHAGDQKFCEEHRCIGNFTQENGTVVECADGTFSHAGGLPGACSDHGGEAKASAAQRNRHRRKPPRAAKHQVGRVVIRPATVAIERAETYWQAKPCGGHIAVEDNPLEVVEVNYRPVSMWTTWQTPQGEDSFTANPASYSECVVHIDPLVWPQMPLDAELRWHEYCQMMTHELGHLEGHSDEGAAYGTIEYPEPSTAPLVAPCRAYPTAGTKKVKD